MIIEFGSCNRQNLPQDHWDVLSAKNPHAFIWLGDAAYAKDNSVEAQATALTGAKASASYQSLLANPSLRHVLGVWDDHDYGVNDGGKHVTQQAERKSNYMKFLDMHPDAGKEDDMLSHEGMYYSRTLRDDKLNVSVKIIFLDTRSFRDSHYIRSIGEVHLPFAALGAAFIRLTYSSLGFGLDYSGDVLGAAQWKWLESELHNSTADINVLVSSIQVATTNPILESWGHFLEAKRKLYDLLAKSDPSGLLLLSGDVHYAEISQISYQRSDGSEGNWLEFTSSGLTHTCADNALTQFICPTMLKGYANHRNPGFDSDSSTLNDDYFIARNFGMINISGDPSGKFKAIVNISLQSVDESLNLAMSRQLFIPNGNEFRFGQRGNSEIISVHMNNFPSLPQEMRYPAITSIAVLLISVVYYFSCILCGRKKSKLIMTS